MRFQASGQPVSDPTARKPAGVRPSSQLVRHPTARNPMRFQPSAHSPRPGPAAKNQRGLHRAVIRRSPTQPNHSKPSRPSRQKQAKQPEQNPQDDRVGCRGLRPGTIPHHRTYGFPYPAVGPAASLAARQAGRRKPTASRTLCIAFCREFRGSRSGFHRRRLATAPPLLPPPAPHLVPPAGKDLAARDSGKTSFTLCQILL